MGDGCHCLCVAVLVTGTHTVFILLVLYSRLAPRNFTAHFDHMVMTTTTMKSSYGKKASALFTLSLSLLLCGVIWPFICYYIIANDDCYRVFGTIAIAIIRNVCVRKMCYGLIIRRSYLYISFECNGAALNGD